MDHVNAFIGLGEFVMNRKRGAEAIVILPAEKE
jgi:hypothetical protein